MEEVKNVSIDAVKSYIYSINFDGQVSKLVTEKKWSKKDALRAVEQYRRYLYLKRKYRHKYNIVPTVDIDELWHLHIIDTHKYCEDCNHIFGDYLHHYPYFGADGKTTFQDKLDAYIQTMKLYEIEFGEKYVNFRSGFKSAIFKIMPNILRNFFQLNA